FIEIRDKLDLEMKILYDNNPHPVKLAFPEDKINNNPDPDSRRKYQKEWLKYCQEYNEKQMHYRTRAHELNDIKKNKLNNLVTEMMSNVNMTGNIREFFMECLPDYLENNFLFVLTEELMISEIKLIS